MIYFWVFIVIAAVVVIRLVISIDREHKKEIAFYDEEINRLNKLLED